MCAPMVQDAAGSGASIVTAPAEDDVTVSPTVTTHDVSGTEATAAANSDTARPTVGRSDVSGTPPVAREAAFEMSARGATLSTEPPAGSAKDVVATPTAAADAANDTPPVATDAAAGSPPAAANVVAETPPVARNDGADAARLAANDATGTPTSAESGNAAADASSLFTGGAGSVRPPGDAGESTEPKKQRTE